MTVDTEKYLDFVAGVTSKPSSDLPELLSRMVVHYNTLLLEHGVVVIQKQGKSLFLPEQKQTLKHQLVVMLLTLNHHQMKNYSLRGILINEHL